jgi:hypothetical protein
MIDKCCIQNSSNSSSFRESLASIHGFLLTGILLLFFDYSVNRLCIAQEPKGQQFSQDTGDFAEVLPIQATHTFTSSALVSTTPPVDLGALTAGKTVNIVVEVRNASGSHFAIKKVRSSCNCMSVRTSAKEVKDGESISLLAELKVPTSATSDVFNQILVIDGETEGTGLQIFFKYQLKGLCCFKEKSLNRDIPKAAKAIPFSLPVLITDPVDVKDVTVIGSGDFSNVKGRIENVDGDYIFRCEVPVPVSSPESLTLAGEFILTHKFSNSKSSVFCVFGRNPKMSLLPSVLHFVRDGDDWSASAVVKVNKEELKSTQDSVFVSASFGRIPIIVEEKTISSGIIRVRLKVKDSEVFDKDTPKWESDSKIHCQVGWEGGIAEKDVSFVFK